MQCVCCRQGKLCLVLDLDHTLINSARFSEVDPEHDALLRHHMAGEANRPADEKQIFRVERIQMWTKLRPAVRRFLYAANQQFELWIHTNGNKYGIMTLLHTALHYDTALLLCFYIYTADNGAFSLRKLK